MSSPVLVAMPCLRDDVGRSLDIMYEGDGDAIAKRFYIPVLKSSSRYDRISGFFSVDSLVVISTGLAGFIRNGGTVRLIVGAHDLGPDLRKVYVLSRERAHQLLVEIGEKIAKSLDELADVIAKKRIEALAWMLVNGTLEIRVAIPKKTFLGLGSGIFHEKVLIFNDTDGHYVAAAGSANETRQAYEANGENLTVHRSWSPGHEEYIERYRGRFAALWENRHEDYYVFDLPEALEKRIRERFYPSAPPEYDPLELPAYARVSEQVRESCVPLMPVAQLVKQLGSLSAFAHLGLGPVRLYPHQLFALNYALSRFPYRILLADEVGLGKTLEAGAIIKRLIDSGMVKRVLVLTPRNVTRQWLDELWLHFGLRFWLLQTGPRQLVASDGQVAVVGPDENPFDRSDIELLIASWHYARGTRRRDPELLRAKRFYDLVVIDEAHSARKKRAQGRVEPTRLNELAMELSIRSPHILMLTATPIQLYAVEAHDLLRVLGIGGPWVHEEDFERYYQVLSSPVNALQPEDWRLLFKLGSYVARNYLEEKSVRNLLAGLFVSDREGAGLLLRSLKTSEFSLEVQRLIKEKPDLMKRLFLSLSPVHWFMIRNTRERLEGLGFTFPERDVKEVPISLDEDHEELLELLDRYLRADYARYERFVSGQNRGVLGFVRSVYHQRFVSSFTAAYFTVVNRREFVEALLRNDEEALLGAASKLLADEYGDTDEDNLIDAMKALLEKDEARRLLLSELESLTELEGRLSPYSLNVLTGRDPKMRAIAGAVTGWLRDGHKVLVFSKYTDTVDAIVKFLLKEPSVAVSEIGVYTGEGGKLFDSSSGKYVKVDKELVRAALDSGQITVLVCSDAASEGLNLQSADAVINVDMPWNPAKVEQRIGRSDRLGQKAPVVYVRNVWYPDTIEARMYRVLFARKQVYRLVVGPAQEIFSEGLMRGFEESSPLAVDRVVDETFKRIDGVKDYISSTGASLGGTSWDGSYSDDEDLVKCLVDFSLVASKVIGLSAELDGGQLVFRGDSRVFPEDLLRWNSPYLEPGKPNALTPAHPIVQWLCDFIIHASEKRLPKADQSIYVVKDFSGRGALKVLEYDGATPETYGRDRVVKVLRDMLDKASGVANSEA